MAGNAGGSWPTAWVIKDVHLEALLVSSDDPQIVIWGSVLARKGVVFISRLMADDRSTDLSTNKR